MYLWLSQSLTPLAGSAGFLCFVARYLTDCPHPVSSFSALAEPSGGEVALKLPDLGSVSFFNDAINGHALLLIGIAILRLRPALRPGDLHPAEEPAGPPRHARDLAS